MTIPTKRENDEFILGLGFTSVMMGSTIAITLLFTAAHGFQIPDGMTAALLFLIIAFLTVGGTGVMMWYSPPLAENTWRNENVY